MLVPRPRRLSLSPLRSYAPSNVVVVTVVIVNVIVLLIVVTIVVVVVLACFPRYRALVSLHSFFSFGRSRPRRSRLSLARPPLSSLRFPLLSSRLEAPRERPFRITSHVVWLSTSPTAIGNGLSMSETERDRIRPRKRHAVGRPIK